MSAAHFIVERRNQNYATASVQSGLDLNDAGP